MDLRLSAFHNVNTIYASATANGENNSDGEGRLIASQRNYTFINKSYIIHTF
jgi:hypothetical protein